MVPRRRLELLHLAATASKTVMSTIPSPGQANTVCEIHRQKTDTQWFFYNVSEAKIFPMCLCDCLCLFRFAELVLEMGLEPTRPKDIRIWNVRVYHSTTRANSTDFHTLYVYSSPLRFGSMAPMCRPYGTRIFAHLPFHHPSESTQYRKKDTKIKLFLFFLYNLRCISDYLLPYNILEHPHKYLLSASENEKKYHTEYKSCSKI